MLPWDPSAVPALGWSSGDQDLRATGPWGTNHVQNLVTKDPHPRRVSRPEGGSGPLVARSRVDVGPLGTNSSRLLVPRGPTPRVSWSFGNHPPGSGRGDLVTGGPGGDACLVPGGPSSRAIWSLRLHVVQFRRMSAGGVVTRGPCFEPGWFPKDQIVPST